MHDGEQRATDTVEQVDSPATAHGQSGSRRGERPGEEVRAHGHDEGVHEGAGGGVEHVHLVVVAPDHDLLAQGRYGGSEAGRRGHEGAEQGAGGHVEQMGGAGRPEGRPHQHRASHASQRPAEALGLVDERRGAQDALELAGHGVDDLDRLDALARRADQERVADHHEGRCRSYSRVRSCCRHAGREHETVGPEARPQARRGAYLAGSDVVAVAALARVQRAVAAHLGFAGGVAAVADLAAAVVALLRPGRGTVAADAEGAGGVAAVAARAVAVVALLARRERAVAAARGRAVRVAAVAVLGVTVVARLSRVDGAIATALGRAGGAAPVTRGAVAVVAALAGADDAVTAGVGEDEDGTRPPDGRSLRPRRPPSPRRRRIRWRWRAPG